MTISNPTVATNGYLLTYLLTYFMSDVRDPGFWARTSRVELKYNLTEPGQNWGQSVLMLFGLYC